MPTEATVELRQIKSAYIVKSGITTAPSGATDVVDINNLTEAANYWKNLTVVLLNGANVGIPRKIIESGIGILTVYPPFPNNIVTGTSYKILSMISPTNTSPLTRISTYTHINNVNEQDVFIVTAGILPADYIIKFNVLLDVSNLTQNTIIKEYTKIININYRQISAKIFPIDFDPGTTVIEISFETYSDYKITFQSIVAEGANRDVDIKDTQVMYT